MSRFPSIWRKPDGDQAWKTAAFRRQHASRFARLSEGAARARARREVTS